MDRSSSEASDNSRINEPADDFKDVTPPLGSEAEPAEIHAVETSGEAASDEHRGPPNGSCAASGEKPEPSDAKLQPDQATPSQKYEDLVIDDELYALGGAVGGSEIDVEYSSADKDAIRRSTAEPDAIYGSTAELDTKRPSRCETDGIRPSKTEFRCPKEEMEEIFGAIAWNLSIGDMDAIPRLIEEMDAKRRSKEEMDAKRCSKEEVDAKRRLKEEMDAIRSATADATAMLSSIGEMAAVHRLKKEMDATRRLTAEMGVIHRSTAEIDSIHRVEAEIDAIQHSTEETDVSCFTAALSDAIGNSIKAVIDNFSSADKASSEVQTDFDNIVKVLFFSWLRFPPKRSRETHEYEFFTPKALQSLATTWKLLKAKRDVLPEPEEVVRGLTETIVQHFYFRNLKLSDEALAAVRRTMATHITELVEEGWQKVLDGIEKEELERKRKRRERRRKFRERMRRAEEIAEVLRFYAPIAQLDNNPPMDCRRFGFLICGYFSLFIYQIPISILLLGWPISIGVMGGLYMTQCPMSQLMPYVMIALGVVGTVALLLRLSYAIYEAFAFYAIHSWWPGILLKSIEFIFLDCLIVQLMYFFSDTPNFDPGTSKYCNETFYNFVSWMNWVSIVLVCYWMFVYVTRGILWLRRRNFDYSYRRN